MVTDDDLLKFFLVRTSFHILFFVNVINITKVKWIVLQRVDHQTDLFLLTPSFGGKTCFYSNTQIILDQQISVSKEITLATILIWSLLDGSFIPEIK